MQGNIFDKFYLITKRIFEEYHNNNMNKLKRLIDIENEEYSKLKLIEIDYLEDYLFNKLNEKKLNFFENYEFALYNNKYNICIQRMYNQIGKLYSRYTDYNNNELEEDINEIEPNIFLIMKNQDGAIGELQSKIKANIETKFLYFLLSDANISKEIKEQIFINLLFVDPYLEEKLLSSTIHIDKYIKEEDELYYNTWKNIKDLYEEIWFNYSLDNIYNTIDIMLSETDLDDDNNTKVRGIFLRTLFNGLDTETLEEINYQFNSTENNIYNYFGEQEIRNSFNEIERDNMKIKKIKTR